MLGGLCTLQCFATLTVLFLKVDVRMSMHKACAAWYIPPSSPLQFVPLPLPLALEYSALKDPYCEKDANFAIPASRCIVCQRRYMARQQGKQHAVACFAKKSAACRKRFLPHTTMATCIPHQANTREVAKVAFQQFQNALQWWYNEHGALLKAKQHIITYKAYVYIIIYYDIPVSHHAVQRSAHN